MYANCECTVLIELQVERTAVSLGGVVKSHSWIFELAGPRQIIVLVVEVRR